MFPQWSSWLELKRPLETKKSGAFRTSFAGGAEELEDEE